MWGHRAPHSATVSWPLSVSPYSEPVTPSSGIWLITISLGGVRVFGPPVWLEQSNLDSFDTESGDIRNWMVLYD